MSNKPLTTIYDMSEKIKCPICMELVDVEFDVCPFCGENLRSVKPHGATSAAPAPPVVPPAPVAPPPPPRIPDAPNQANGSDWSGPTPPSAYEPEESAGFFSTFIGREFFGRYADFSGMTARRDYWLTVLAFTVLQFGLYGMLALLVGITPVVGLIVMYAVCSIVGLAVLVPSLAIAVRRLRDTGKSPWMILLGLIPLVGPILMIVFFCQKGYTQRREFSFGVADGALTAVCFILFFTGIYFAFSGVARTLNNIDFDRMEQLDMPRIDESDDDYSDDAEEVEEVVAMEEMVAEPAAASGEISGTYRLSGTVAGTPFILEMLVNGGTVTGRCRYAKINPPSWIDVEGYFSDGRYFAFIETNGEEVTGDYDCEAVFDSRGNFTGIKGKMTNYKGKTYKVDLTVI